MNEHDLRDTIREQLRPDAATTERILRRIEARTAADTAPRTQRRRAPRRLVQIGLATAGAAIVALVVALSPLDRRDGGRTALVPAPATARAALEQAASAAGSAPWSPLTAGTYHHVMTTSFTPTDIPTRPGDSRAKIDQMFSFQPPTSRESWLDANGDGFAINAHGGSGDPDEYPTVDASGYGFGASFGRNGLDADSDVTVDASLRLADMLRVERTRGARVSDGLWYRTPDGYQRKGGKVGTARVDAMFGTLREFNQKRNWRATYPALATVNEASGAALTKAVAELLDRPEPGFDSAVSAQGLYGVTKEMEREEIRVQRAVQLLGSAPLGPRARQAIFEWLAARPSAKLLGDATDERGRRGTHVVLERINLRTAPAYTVTSQQLRAQWAASQGVPVPAGPARGPRVIDVPEDRQFRRWYVAIIFDRSSGELLQHVMYTRQETTAMRPRFDRDARPGDGYPWRIRMAVDRQGMSDATIYDVRERTTRIAAARTAACTITPAMCTTS